MKKNIKEMDVVFLLDKSGSMSGLEEDTIGGYNSFLEKQKKNKCKTYITTILFDHYYEVLHDRVDAKEVKKITNKDYYVEGTTALYDAIGKTISRIERKAKNVIFVITTDGYENSSKEYTRDMIKKLIKKHSDWEFMYIGADIDSYEGGAAIGINRSNIANYKKDKKGTSFLFDSVYEYEDCLYKGKDTSKWKQKLDDYLDENK